MFGIFDRIADAIKQFLIGLIQGNLENMFTDVNDKVGTIASQVGQTPQGWNTNVFAIIKNLSETVIVPIAGMIITFVLCYELINLIMEKNNMHDVDTFMFFKYFFKMWVAVYLVTHTFDITMAVFDVAGHVVTSSGSVITGTTSIDITSVTSDLQTTLDAKEVPELLLITLETSLIGLTLKALSICITVILYGRMIEIYLYCSVSAIPFATMTNREWGSIGNNYLKGLLALGFQGFFIMVCVGIYSALIQNITVTSDIQSAILSIAAYTVLLCFSLFKTGSLAKSVFGAH